MNTLLSFLSMTWDIVCLLCRDGFDVSGDEDEVGYSQPVSRVDSSAPEGHEVGAYLAPADHNGWGTVADFSFAEVDFDYGGHSSGSDPFDS